MQTIEERVAAIERALAWWIEQAAVCPAGGPALPRPPFPIGADAPPTREPDEDAVKALPCPFCGGTDLETGTILVLCNTCQASGPVEGPDGDVASIAAWNRRALAAAPRPEPEGRCVMTTRRGEERC